MVLLLIAIVLFAVAAYFGLDAITVRQKQIAVSLNRARTLRRLRRCARPSSAKTSRTASSPRRSSGWPASPRACR